MQCLQVTNIDVRRHGAAAFRHGARQRFDKARFRQSAPGRAGDIGHRIGVEDGNETLACRRDVEFGGGFDNMVPEFFAKPRGIEGGGDAFGIERRTIRCPG